MRNASGLNWVVAAGEAMAGEEKAMAGTPCTRLVIGDTHR